MMLSVLFGIKFVWFSDFNIVWVMVIIVNIWLGYFYMMILCMGLLKVILDDLYEVFVMDGVGLFQNFFKIILLLLIKLLMLLMIVSFVFNFNNFVLIQLLINGGLDCFGIIMFVGYIDLFVSYIYCIVFEGGGGQDFGLVVVIVMLIFLLVGVLVIVNLKVMCMKFD